MRRPAAPVLALALALALASAAPVLAEGPAGMTADERAAFREEVRNYLMENPEVIVEAMGVLQAREDAAAAEREAAVIAARSDEIFANPADWVGGNPDGDITLVAFIDYRCGFCRKAHHEVQALLEADGNIRLVIKEFPILGEASLLSSQFAITVRLLHGDAAYAAAHDALITLRGEATAETLGRLAAELGHDPAPILAQMDSDAVNATITANHALAEAMGISGTPTFVVRDMLLRGYVPLDGMQAIIAELRAEG